MPIGHFEKEILTLLAGNRGPDSYIGGATVLNQSPDSPRTSEDIDVFHETETAVGRCSTRDMEALDQSGYRVDTLFRTPTFCRARVQKGAHATRLEWVYDSAFRFFPIEPDPELGYRLHFWDAATNKVLAGVGRGVIRDFVDLIHLHETRLSLGALIWAAAGKDLGLNPHFIVGELKRTHHHPEAAYASIKLTVQDAIHMQAVWRSALENAVTLFDEILLDAPNGCFFLDTEGHPQTPDATSLSDLTPHFGTPKGCWPRIVEE